MYSIMFRYFIFLTSLTHIVVAQKCFKPDVLITQNVENEGFHRTIKYLIEFSNENTNILLSSACKVALKQDIPSGLYINADQIADLIRIKKVYLRRSTGNITDLIVLKVSAIIDGKINVESPMHLSESHAIYVFSLNDTFSRIQLQLPIHLRYQRAIINGGFGKIDLPKPSLLVHCPEGSILCGRSQKVEAPCNHLAAEDCMWSNVSFKSITNDIEMLVPVGDLDHYPIVSIVTFLVACAGCIYILSVLSTTVL